jgi:tRNA (cmo5U34)-methyltransferase
MKFDFNTIENFDDHIDKSIPGYNILVQIILSMSEYFFVKGKNIYDLGCSTGKLLNSISCECNKIGLDNSNLLPKLDGFFNVDLNNNLEIDNACVVYSIFTMQFLNPDNRLNYLKNIYEGLNVGGCLFLCEKVYQENGKLQEIFTFSHYDQKLKNFNSEEIIKKERDIRHIMKPCLSNNLDNLLELAGFKNYSIFWQNLNFKAILAIKE